MIPRQDPPIIRSEPEYCPAEAYRSRALVVWRGEIRAVALTNRVLGLAVLRLAIVCLLASPALARGRKALPDAKGLLADSLQGPAVPYEGRLKIEIFGAEKISRRIDVRFSPPSSYRREILGPRRTKAQLFVSDGKTAWIYDPDAGKAWQGPPPQKPGAVSGLEDGYELIAANYDASISTSKPVAGRAVWELDLRSRFDDQLRRKLWIDKKNRLVLKSEILGPDGAVSSEVHFTRIAFTDQDPAQFAFSPPQGVSVAALRSPDRLTLEQAEKSAGMKPLLPAWTPAGYALKELTVMTRGGHKVIHGVFSDGVDALSLFQYPEGLPLDFDGKSVQTVSLPDLKGTLAWSSEGAVFAWTPRHPQAGSRFVLIGPVSPEVLEKMAESLP